MDDEEKKSIKLAEEKIQKLIRDLTVLKNALLKEQSLRKEIEDKLRDKEIEFRQKEEQMESLEFNNSRLSKRVESLMEELSKKGEGKSSFINNLLHGKHKEELEKQQKSLQILAEDLQAKIEENEKLHIRMFEFKEEQRGKVESLEAKMKEYIRLNEDQDKLIRNLREKEGTLTQEVDELEARKKMLERELNEKIKQLAYQEFTFRQEKEKLSTKVRDLSDTFRRRLPFDEYKNSALNSLNMPRPKKSEASQSELLQKVLTSGELGMQKLEELVSALINKLTLVSTYAEAEDQKDYNTYSKKVSYNIRDALPEYSGKWKEFLQEILKTLALFAKLDLKTFRKNTNAILERSEIAKEIEDKCNKIINQFPEVGLMLESIEKLLRSLFSEEITLVQEIGYMKEKNEAIFNEFKEFKGCIFQIFESIKEIMLYNTRDTCVNSEKKATLWLKIAASFRKISKKLENVVILYREKLTREEEGLEKRNSMEEDESKRIVYTFRDQMPVNKFKNINNDIASLLQSFATHTTSAIICFSEYIEKEFEHVAPENGSSYPANFMGPSYLRKVGITQAINEHMKSQQKGIPYHEALDNKKVLNALQEKETFYLEQISSLKNALMQAEAQIDCMKDDDQSTWSDASTVKLHEKELGHSPDVSQVFKIVSFLKEKYEEACKKTGDEPTFTDGEITAELLEKWTKPEPQPVEKKELKKKDSSPNGGFDLFHNNDMDYLSENVAKGLQRISMKYMNNQLKLVPLNTLTQTDENDSEKTRILFEKARDKILELALKNEHLEQEHEDFMMQYEAMKEAMNSEKILREQTEKSSKELEKTIFKLKTEMESIKSNYDGQIKMLSEHIISLSSAKDKK